MEECLSKVKGICICCFYMQLVLSALPITVILFFTLIDGEFEAVSSQ